MTVGQQVDGINADIVAAVGVLGARVAEPEYEQVRCQCYALGSSSTFEPRVSIVETTVRSPSSGVVQPAGS